MKLRLLVSANDIDQDYKITVIKSRVKTTRNFTHSNP